MLRRSGFAGLAAGDGCDPRFCDLGESLCVVWWCAAPGRARRAVPLQQSSLHGGEGGPHEPERTSVRATFSGRDSLSLTNPRVATPLAVEDVLSVGGDPVGGDFVLRGANVEAVVADAFVQFAF